MSGAKLHLSTYYCQFFEEHVTVREVKGAPPSGWRVVFRVHKMSFGIGPIYAEKKAADHMRIQFMFALTDLVDLYG